MFSKKNIQEWKSLRGVDLDVHELLKDAIVPVRTEDISDGELLDWVSTFSPQSSANPSKSETAKVASFHNKYTVYEKYLILDSYYKLSTSRPDLGEFEWKIGENTTKSLVGVNDSLRNIIAIRVGHFYLPPLKPIKIPKAVPPEEPLQKNSIILVPDERHPTFVKKKMPLIPYGSRITLEFKELGSQSYSDVNGHHHQFEFKQSDLKHENGSMEVKPTTGWDSYTFAEPIREIQQISLVFRNPDQRLSFYPDIYPGVRAEVDHSPYPGPFLQFSLRGLVLELNDHIFVKGFASGHSELDLYVNRVEGHLVTEIYSKKKKKDSSSSEEELDNPKKTNKPAPKPTPKKPEIKNRFSLNPMVSIADLSAPKPVLPQTVSIYVAKRRLRIPVRFRCIAPRVSGPPIPITSIPA